MAKLSKKNEELLKAVQKQAAREQGASASSAVQSKVKSTSPHDTQVSPEASEKPLAQSAPTTQPQRSADTRSNSAVGLGVDLVEIERMERAIERTPRILERVFTSGEREYAWSKAKPAVHYAAFFAAREAVVKALGTGFNGINYTDIEIMHDSKGKPEVVLHGNAEVCAQEQGIVEIQISLSHTHQMAVASAVAIKAQSSPQKNEATDPMEELTRQFKELRSMLDDMGIGQPEGSSESIANEEQESAEEQE